MYRSPSIQGSLVFLTALQLAACGGQEDEDPEVKAIATAEKGLIGGGQAGNGDWDSTLEINGCTAARVGPRHIITAAHCVQNRINGRGFHNVRDGFRPGDLLRITNSKTFVAGTFFFRQIASATMHPSWTQACTGGCPNNLATLWPYPPDIAVIRVTSDLPSGIPMAKIDARPIARNERMTILGYGCETSLNNPGTSVQRRLKFERLRSQTPLNSAMQHEYIASPGMSQNPSEASLCFGDSGGPVYRGWSRSGTKIVGINAYYTFTSNSGVSFQNLHTDLSRDNPHDVVNWLLTQIPPGQITGL